MSTNNTFRPGTLANAGGTKSASGQTLTVEFLSADPPLTAGVPRIWVNTTGGVMKFSHDGAAVKTVTAT